MPDVLMRTCLLLLISLATGTVAKGQETPAYVGSAACTDCHQDQAAAWARSHHAAAWTLPSDETVLGDFGDDEFVHQGVTHRFSREGTRFMVETDGPEGRARYPILGVAGIAPLQQYLVETEPGRVQSHDVVWDVEERRWYHLYPDQRLSAADGLHWTGVYKTWNARCAECHATGYEKRYSARARAYDSRQAEIGVGCEACHGPGEAHLAWAGGQEVPEGLTEAGFTIGFSAGRAETEIQQCAGCHSRREALLDGNPLPGTPYGDAYRLSLLRDGLYHADGAIRDEVYVYGSFLQSKMYAKGVRCSDCHDPHAAERVAEGNAVCTQCHSEAGNTRFPSLRKAAYDAPAHHFHEQGSAGAECRSCHMIERVYMGVDGRRDHSFRVPRPDLSDATGAPNACIDCHEGRSNRWAADAVALRYPQSRHRGPHFGQAFAAGRFDAAASLEPVMAIAEDPEAPAIVRATALELLRPVTGPDLAARAAPLLSDPSPLVRDQAVGIQRGAPSVQRIERLLPLLDDPVRSVRIAAAREFLDLRMAHMPDQVRQSLGAANREWQRSLMRKADFPESHLVIGGAALTFRDMRSAEQAFGEAARLDPQRTDAWAMVIRIRHALGNLDGARTALAEATAANPADFTLLSLGPLVEGDGVSE